MTRKRGRRTSAREQRRSRGRGRNNTEIRTSRVRVRNAMSPRKERDRRGEANGKGNRPIIKNVG